MNEKIRSNKVKWIYNDCWIAGVLAHMILCANKTFQYDLSGFEEAIQYTVYSEKGSHYSWHRDQTVKKNENIRKLSITLSLSDPTEYEGGEFQIHNGCNMSTHKLKKGDAIIFPSTLPHRVRPVKSGVRRSLVAWYWGPPWK